MTGVVLARVAGGRIRVLDVWAQPLFAAVTFLVVDIWGVVVKHAAREVRTTSHRAHVRWNTARRPNNVRFSCCCCWRYRALQREVVCHHCHAPQRAALSVGVLDKRGRVEVGAAFGGDGALSRDVIRALCRWLGADVNFCRVDQDDNNVVAVHVSDAPIAKHSLFPWHAELIGALLSAGHIDGNAWLWATISVDHTDERSRDGEGVRASCRSWIAVGWSAPGACLKAHVELRPVDHLVGTCAIDGSVCVCVCVCVCFCVCVCACVCVVVVGRGRDSSFKQGVMKRLQGRCYSSVHVLFKSTEFSVKLAASERPSYRTWSDVSMLSAHGLPDASTVTHGRGQHCPSGVSARGCSAEVDSARKWQPNPTS
jgi:hypothetical protein